MSSTLCEAVTTKWISRVLKQRKWKWPIGQDDRNNDWLSYKTVVWGMRKGYGFWQLIPLGAVYCHWRTEASRSVNFCQKGSGMSEWQKACAWTMAYESRALLRKELSLEGNTGVPKYGAHCLLLLPLFPGLVLPRLQGWVFCSHKGNGQRLERMYLIQHTYPIGPHWKNYLICLLLFKKDSD